MNDDNWETISGPVAQDIEFLNYQSQTNVLEALTRFLLAHKGPLGNGAPPMPDEQALLDLHRAGTLFLLAEPGQYRNTEVHVIDPSGATVYQPPPWQYVRGLMQQFFRQMSSLWTTGDALTAAAFALWQINWIHPFRNGNGRTARAFSYACLCLRIGAVLPGTSTIPDQIMGNRDRYEAALRAADAAYKATRVPDLNPMRSFLDDLLQKQIQSAGISATPTAPQ